MTIQQYALYSPLRYPRRPWSPLFLLTILVIIFSGCGRGKDDAAPGAATISDADSSGVSNEFTPNWEARLLTSPEGKFEAYWPTGCAKLRIRTRASSSDPQQNMSVEVTCKRDLTDDYGCKVTVYFEMPDGGMATPEYVTGGIARTAATLGLEILKQAEMKSNGMDGVVAFCREAGGTRIVWIEGYLDHGRVLQTMAWGPDGRIYEDQDIMRFMRSVKFVE